MTSMESTVKGKSMIESTRNWMEENKDFFKRIEDNQFAIVDIKDNKELPSYDDTYCDYDEGKPRYPWRHPSTQMYFCFFACFSVFSWYYQMALMFIIGASMSLALEVYLLDCNLHSSLRRVSVCVLMLMLGNMGGRMQVMSEMGYSYNSY